MNPREADSEDRAFLLLMNDEEAEFFARLLAKHAPDAYFAHAGDRASLVFQAESLPGTGRLIAFCTDVIVPPAVLERMEAGSYNFHPGPPERPGYRPAGFAAHEKGASFGITLHEMEASVDTGAIIDCERFSVSAPASEEAINIEAYRRLLNLARRHARTLAETGSRPSPSRERWSGRKTTRRDWQQIQSRRKLGTRL
ncbi:hypothetical protein GR183_07805 [Stappia sp. GBMRC 2046]|uniref:Formyl transferase N-terminal domain-containing protein n=1 Tax=Stappia sediminis TaxID=2692190 RepID=A0A7X3LTI4_9HYPH|nr:hypothetical protein [Stappia sediminis]MXN64808.1 hypothetical protein [Stappia sediminis]